MSHRAWIRQAESDLQAAEALSGRGFHSQAVWLATQAVEKGHKAILAALGLQLEDRHYKNFGHDITGLSQVLPDELQEPRDAGIAREIVTLQALASSCRYPQPSRRSGPPASTTTAPAESAPPALIAPADSFRESSVAVTAARTLLDWCKDRVARARRGLSAMSVVESGTHTPSDPFADR